MRFGDRESRVPKGIGTYIFSCAWKCYQILFLYHYFLKLCVIVQAMYITYLVCMYRGAIPGGAGSTRARAPPIILNFTL